MFTSKTRTIGLVSNTPVYKVDVRPLANMTIIRNMDEKILGVLYHAGVLGTYVDLYPMPLTNVIQRDADHIRTFPCTSKSCLWDYVNRVLNPFEFLTRTTQFPESIALKRSFGDDLTWSSEEVWFQGTRLGNMMGFHEEGRYVGSFGNVQRTWYSFEECLAWFVKVYTYATIDTVPR